MVFLRDFVVILAAAVVVVSLLHRLHVPSIAGFIAAGALVGPNALGFVQSAHHVEVLAEAGVVMLLFGIGLDLSLDRGRGLWRAITVGGVVQVGTTILAVVGAALAFGLEARTAVLLGFIIAVSSTAIVLRGLSARGDLETPHGRLTLGILVFQDLCVVPMVLSIPLLAGTSGAGAKALLPLLTAAGVLVGVLLAAWLIVPRLLQIVARTRQRDLFVLTVFLICLGTAWAVASAGVSLALGAFLAGMVVAGSQYRQQAFSDVVPLREVLASVFFVSIGMLLDFRNVLSDVLPILGLLFAIVVGKFTIVFLTAAVMRLPLRVCVLTGAALAQVGEFSFVLLRVSSDTDLLTEPLLGNLTVAVILSMLFTPFAIALGPHVATGLHKMNPLTRLLRVRPLADIEGDVELRAHVVIAGYGAAGQRLAKALTKRGIPLVIADMNPGNIRDAVSRGDPVYFGDVTSVEVLEHLGIANSRALVIAINDVDAACRATKAARHAAPDLHIVVRVGYLLDVDRLIAAGASRVVAAEAVAAVETTNHVLRDLEADLEA